MSAQSERRAPAKKRTGSKTFTSSAAILHPERRAAQVEREGGPR